MDRTERFYKIELALRSRGIGVVVVLLDASAFEVPADAEQAELIAQRERALRHALAEYELPTYVVGPGRDLGEVLAR